ncbi:unnamed protein product [Rotaria socialis]|uniref:Daxx histone-binding domain-containing protein n=1 Tax=Rotaria socialis TaxID=392032 RepID=A0A820BK98_9BILA|nr:unnamed protein product [Rotaria socialis]
MENNMVDNIRTEFEKFVSLIGDILVGENEIDKIQNKLRHHFNATSPSYLCSRDFTTMLQHIHNVFTQNHKSTKYYSLLVSFTGQMKINSIKSRGSHQSPKEIYHNVESIASVLCKNEAIASQSEVEQMTESKSPISNPKLKTSTDSTATVHDKMEPEKKIRRLQRRLRLLSKTIRELEERDMSLVEMEHCDLYVVESNLKKQAYEVILAELKNQSTSAERVLDQLVTLAELEIDSPFLNKALEDMVNRTKFLPSFNDVLDTVEKMNDKYKLNLGVDTRKKLAEKSFKLIGKKVKNRRMADFNDIMNSRLPEDFDMEHNDPALNNIEFQQALLKNEHDAIIKTEKVFEEFSQIDPRLESEIIIESCEEFADDSDEERKDDEEEIESEIEMIVESPNSIHEETEYQTIDTPPPCCNRLFTNDAIRYCFEYRSIPVESPKSLSPVATVVTEEIDNKDSVEATVEISLNNNTLKILSTTIIPIAKSIFDSFTSLVQKSRTDSDTARENNNINESPPIAFIREHKVKTIVPRRRQNVPTEEMMYTLFKTRLMNTNNSRASQKRTSSIDVESLKTKRPRTQDEVIIID